MKTVSKFSLTVMLLAALGFLPGCKKKSEETPTAGPVPVVSTVNYSNVLLNTAVFSGNVTDDRGLYVSRHGFCWSASNPNPTILNDSMVAGDGAGIFAGTIKGLKGQSKYYVRAFATNGNGTGYGSILTFTTIDTTITDIDNNRYKIVQIGTQVWMAENLKTTRFKDGRYIDLVTDSVAWSNLLIGGYCWYNNDPSNYASTYGALYNWYAVDDGYLAPAGWHVPSNAECNTLVSFLGGDPAAMGKMKEAGTSHWLDPNTGADNSSGFSGLPGGERFPLPLSFEELSYWGNWWTTTSYLSSRAYCIGLNYGNQGTIQGTGDYKSGLSVRCIKD